MIKQIVSTSLAVLALAAFGLATTASAEGHTGKEVDEPEPVAATEAREKAKEVEKARMKEMEKVSRNGSL